MLEQMGYRRPEAKVGSKADAAQSAQAAAEEDFGRAGAGLERWDGASIRASAADRFGNRAVSTAT